MEFVQSILDKIRELIDYFTNLGKNEDSKEDLEDKDDSEDITLNMDLEDKDDRFVVKQRTIISKLYSLSQMIKSFDNIFPEKYDEFLKRIEVLMEDYKNTLELYLKGCKNEIITFEMDPDQDFKRNSEVIKLEKEINDFINNDLKFCVVSKKIQKLCLKLNITYNISFRYYKESDMQKIVSQLKIATEVLKDIILDLKSYGFFISDKMKKEYLIDFISYADYLIFKCNLKNSKVSVSKLLEQLLIKEEFVGLDVDRIIRDFIIDELENIQNMIESFQDENARIWFLGRIQKLQSTSISVEIDNEKFWQSVLEIENDVLNHLRFNNENVKIPVLARFNIEVDEKEVFFSVKSQACLTLEDIYYKTQDILIFFVIRLISLLDDEVTYKEIYFILVLFDLVDKIISKKEISRSFVANIDKQAQKNKNLYTRETIERKKINVLSTNSITKKYAKICTADEYNISKICQTLKERNFDFVATGDSIYLNTFYFNKLDNVIRCLNKVANYINK